MWLEPPRIDVGVHSLHWRPPRASGIMGELNAQFADRPHPRGAVSPPLDQLAGALALLLVLAAGATRVLAGDAAPGNTDRTVHADEGTIQGVVDDLKTRLSMADAVRVAIVESNPRVVSVEPPAGGRGPFVLVVERGFLEDLTADELRAVVAHELGHVWIFTHHPYLQTEELANRIAMRVVSRESLERIYEKLWKRTGATGDLARVLGGR
jgi:hypothetical protein